MSRRSVGSLCTASFGRCCDSLEAETTGKQRVVVIPQCTTRCRATGAAPMPAELPRRAAAAATAAHRWRPCRPHVAGLRSIGWRSTHEQTREERGVALAEELDDDGAATERQRVERLLRADGRVARLVADERLALLQVGEEVLHGAVLLAQRLQRRLVELQHTAKCARYSHSTA